MPTTFVKSFSNIAARRHRGIVVAGFDKAARGMSPRSGASPDEGASIQRLRRTDMRDRLAVVAATSAMCLLLAVSPYARAQQENQKPAATTNPTAGENRNQASSATATIRGVIAGITAEGEVMFDHRANKAVAAEATFLTVVGSPVKMEGAEGNRSSATPNEERGASHRHRHNVYYVWLTPRTKICEGTASNEKSGAQAETQRSEQKRELALDKLEIGDRVEIQFTKNDDSGSTGSAHQTDQMRTKHGRHRTHVGFATEVKILSSSETGSHDAAPERREKSGSQ
jgi:hypothetical protein